MTESQKKVLPAGLKERLEYNNDYSFDTSGFSRDPEEFKDGYQLRFIGKDYARLQSGTAPETMIIPNEKHNLEDCNRNSENLYFTGDNLEVLKHLQSAYRRAIKVIYIDPPYNTGGDGFVYKDKFDFSDEQLKNMLGMTDDEIKRLHSINGKSSHSAWLTFMYPRLKLAKNLLSDDGVIFISIDDNEQANLKLLCDEIFNEANFVANFIAVSAPAGTQSSVNVAQQHSYCLAYAKQGNKLNFLLKRTKEEINERYSNNDQGGRYYSERLWKRGVGGRKEDVPTLHFPVFYNKKTNEILVDNECIDICNFEKIIPYQTRGVLGRWTWSREKMINERNKLLVRKVDNEWRLFKKVYENEETGKLPNSIIDARIARTELGSIEVKGLFDNKVFEYPKGSEFIKYLVSLMPDNSVTVLDFFSGSATTAHAVMKLNKEDNGSRKWIMVQIDEKVNENSDAQKNGYKTIDEIGRERIKLAAKQIGDTSGFKHYYVKEPEVQTLDKIIEFNPDTPMQPDMFKNMVTEFDNNETNAKGEDVILTTWLVADGYKLNNSVMQIDIAGYKAYYVDNSLLYLISQGWGKEQTRELLNLVGTRKINLNTIILFGYSFGFESLKELEINVKQSLSNQVSIEKRF